MLTLLRQAACVALSNGRDRRGFYVGSIGIREDGAKVHSKNSAIIETQNRHPQSQFFIYRRFPQAHAESKLVQKLGFYGTVYVARVARGSQQLAMARPCSTCQQILKAYKVKKVYYTISPTEWGMWNPKTNEDIYYSK